MAGVSQPNTSQPEMWSVPAGSITLEQFLTAHQYEIAKEELTMEKHPREIYAPEHKTPVGNIQGNPPQIRVSYYLLNPQALQTQLAFRNLLDKNKICYEESPVRTVAAENLIAHAKDFMNLAHLVDELSVRASSFGESSS